ncbi:VWA domain-containing protein [bacterium]|nr:VWA domain-containing protein [bacterium]
MFRGPDPALMLLARPEWLALLPLVLLPVLRERLRPISTAAVAAGWEAENIRSLRQSFLRRWLIPALLCAGAFCAVVALASPVRPVIAPLMPAQRGHFWAVLLDCSGSMAIVDPGRQFSRLRLLADDLAEVITDRPQDRFAVIRVAGYADRVGPAESSSRFLVDRLRQIAPALPGEDGTNLGDGLVLAANSLPPDVNPDARSILIVSDGRENPPDARSFRLKDIAPRLVKSGIRVDWLRLDLPAEPDESPESMALGEASRLVLENLVRESGGSVIDGEPGGDRSAIVRAAIANFAGGEDNASKWPSASTALVIATFFSWALAVFLSLTRSIRNRPITATWIVRIAALAFAIGSAGIAAITAVQASQIQFSNSSQTKSRWLILLDASPSMAAADSAGGSRLAAATKLAKSLIGRLSLDAGARGAIVRFSGRAVPQSGWTEDWNALESIVEETDLYAIRPSGSDWNSALRTSLEFGDDQGNERDSKVETHLIVLTDGEASREPDQEAIDSISNRKWLTTFVTFGDDQQPGATFRNATNANSPWIDRRTGTPARSARSDSLAETIATKTGGRVLSVGPAQFDAWDLAEAIAGESETSKPRSPIRIDESGSTPFFLTIASIAFFLIAEVAGIRKVRPAVRASEFIARIPIVAMICIFFSCTKPAPISDSERMIESAWAEYRSGKSTQARAMLAIAASRFPNEPVIRYDLALIELGRNEPDEALKSLEESTRLLENSTSVDEKNKITLQARIEAATGYALILAGHPEEAVATLTRAIESNGLTDAERADAEINANYAKSVLNRGKPSKAAIPKEPNGPEMPDQAEAEPRMVTSNGEISQWTRMAGDVRNRARIARARFEPAGDELKSGTGKLPGDSESIDW